MSDIADLNSLVAAIKPYTTARGSLIGIEGHSTAGKTTLSTHLTDLCGGAAIATDNYVDRDSKAVTYPDRILREKLSADLARLRLEQSVVFIEGICLRETLGRLGIVPQAFVYCQRITQSGLWADDPQNYLETGSPRSDLSWVDQQSVIYHLQARPRENADLVYAWREH